ncbi:MAG TPA: hypothetical protein VLA72_17790 [Anaerolineales bacterium]|jgi:uncharacterized protein with PIN domain|nr:hypothetical protein [Anaerolineales bacterium]
MIFIPRVFDREQLAQKYQCPSCAGFVRIDQQRCQHCNTKFTEVARDEMRSAFHENARESTPYVLMAIGVAVGIVLFVVALFSFL